MKCCFVFDVTLQAVISIHVYKMCCFEENMLCNCHQWNKKTKTSLVIDRQISCRRVTLVTLTNQGKQEE